jgi:hypothetical protein
MYSMSSTPLTCCSIGAATVSASVICRLIGYATETLGGPVCPSRAALFPRQPTPMEIAVASSSQPAAVTDNGRRNMSRFLQAGVHAVMRGFCRRLRWRIRAFCWLRIVRYRSPAVG